jgi:hypothetical protein
MESSKKDLKFQEVSESDAPPEVEEVYGRIKETLRVGVVNYVWRVFATKPAFLRTVWDQLEPAVDEGFMQAAEGIRALAIERVRAAKEAMDDLVKALDLPAPNTDYRGGLGGRAGGGGPPGEDPGPARTPASWASGTTRWTRSPPGSKPSTVCFPASSRTPPTCGSAWAAERSGDPLPGAFEQTEQAG